MTGVSFVDRSLYDVSRGRLPRQYGPYRERQGVPEMGLSKAAQTPLPAQKVSCKADNHTLTFLTDSAAHAHRQMLTEMTLTLRRGRPHQLL